MHSGGFKCDGAWPITLAAIAVLTQNTETHD